MSRRSPARPVPPTASRKDGAARRPAAPASAAPPARAYRPLLDPRLWTLLVLSAGLAFLYARAIPVGGNPDEGAHLQFVKTVATEGRLPRLNLSEHRRSLADVSYEAHQPPLYYVLAAPFYRIGEAIDAQDGPGQACRSLSVLIGLGGIVLVWLLAWEVAPDRPSLRLAATAVVALLPMRLAIMASVSNDTLAEATCTLVLLLLLRAVRGRWTVRQWAGLGLAVSLALLSKQSNLMLLPVVGFALLVAARVAGPEPGSGPEADEALKARSLLASMGAVAGVIVLTAGWWFVRNQLIYGDPLAQRAFTWYFADTPTWEKFRDLNGYTFQRYMFEKVIPTSFDSFWGAFGYLVKNRAGDQPFMGAYPTPTPVPHWEYPPRSTVYPWLWAATGAAVAGGGLYVLRRRARAETVAATPEGSNAVPAANVGVGLLALHAGFVAASFLRFITQYFQAQGRYFFPALAAISLGLAGGWLEWTVLGARLTGGNEEQRVRRRAAMETVLAWLVVAGMLVLASYALYDTLIPYYLHS